MIEKIGHIRNPLTVIAMFAAIAEVSGALVLPFLEEGNQRVYIAFLMIFPTLLVGLFFTTLNRNPKVLYAPSDWKDEKNFVRLIAPATPEDRKEKIEAELAESVPTFAKDSDGPAVAAIPEDEANDGEPPKARPPLRTRDKELPPPSRIGEARKHMQRLAAIEAAALQRLSAETGKTFQREVTYHSSPKDKFFFDGLALEKDHVTAVEVRYVPGSSGITPISRLLFEGERAARSFMEQGGADFSLYLVLVRPKQSRSSDFIDSVRREISRFDYDIKLMTYDAEELIGGQGADEDAPTIFDPPSP